MGLPPPQHRTVPIASQARDIRMHQGCEGGGGDAGGPFALCISDLYSGPMIRSRPCRPWASFGLVLQKK